MEGGQFKDYTLNYDAENRVVKVQKNGAAVAQFTYDGDGNRVMSVIDGITTRFVGNYYELTGSQVTKYYGVYPELVEGPERLALRCTNTPSLNP